jgi:uncharacterized protein
MKNEPLAGWKAFLASPDAPETAMPAIELEGYLAGLVVVPDLIPPSMWIPEIWGDAEPVFDSSQQLRAALDSLMDHYNAVIRQIDTKGAKWKPMFFASDGAVDVDRCSLWVRGFWKALRLAPDGWMVLARDERTQCLVEPFAAFLDPDELHGFDGPPLPDNIDDIRRACAEEIPHVLPAWRKFAQIRAEYDTGIQRQSGKTGRNEPCPCGSGKKYKRCCGLN